jgi:hypothetical protein
MVFDTFLIPAMQHAAQQPTIPQSGSEEFDPTRGKYPKKGITGDQLFQLDLSIAVPACPFADRSWWNRNNYRIPERINQSQLSHTITNNGIKYRIPVISYGCLYPVVIPFGEVCHGEIDCVERITRNGLTPSFCPTNSTVSSVGNFPFIKGNDHLGNLLGLCPLWIQTSKGTNRHKIVEKLKEMTYYVLVHDSCQVPQLMSFKSKYVKWDPIVWRRNSTGKLVHPSPDWIPSHNMTIERRPSPLAWRDTENQTWMHPEPQTQIPGFSAGCVPITMSPCGIKWTGRKKGIVNFRTKKGVYLGPECTMQVSSWGEYNRNYKGKTFRREIDCSLTYQFSQNSFAEGYNWDEELERWVLSVFDSDSDDDDRDDGDDSYDVDDGCDCRRH